MLVISKFNNKGYVDYFIFISFFLNLKKKLILIFLNFLACAKKCVSVLTGHTCRRGGAAIRFHHQISVCGSHGL